MEDKPNKSLLKAVLQVLATRLELFSLELSEEKQHISRMLVTTVVFSTFLILFIVSLLALLLFLLWESPYKYWYIGICVVGFGVAAFASLVGLRRLLFRQIPFDLSIRELKNDIDILSKRRGE